MTKAQTAHSLCNIALKAHDSNTSPVDIKQKLAELPVSILHQLQAETAQALDLENKKPSDEHE